MTGFSNHHNMSGSNGYIYVFYLGFFDQYKIGTCKNIERRFKELSASNPRLRAVISSIVMHPRSVEKQLHDKYKSRNTGREIYSLSPEDLDHIQRYLDECGHSEYIPLAKTNVAGS